jgi:hypothetical protein
MIFRARDQNHDAGGCSCTYMIKRGWGSFDSKGLSLTCMPEAIRVTCSGVAYSVITDSR